MKSAFEEEVKNMQIIRTDLKSQLESEEKIKHEGELQLKELELELQKIKATLAKEEYEHKKVMESLQSEFNAKVEQLEKRSETLSAENFEYAMENVSKIIQI